jgi:GNAT superfamily N-acetyltransferase
MKTSHRNYSESIGDFNRLAHFFMAHHQHIRRHSTWSLGRLVDWKYGLYENKMAYPSFCQENAELWFNGFDQLTGFVISESGDAGLTIITLPGYLFLFEDMLDWALSTWSERGPIFSIEITENQAHEATILQLYGFQQVSAFFTRRFDLTGDLNEPFPLEPGFSIVDMATHPDYRAQRILRDNAFKDQQTITEEDLARELRFYNYGHHGPIYHAETDLCVMAADGRMVAGCEAMIDAVNCEADIERVCTHSDFRHRGFARAVIHECLHRLKKMGLNNAFITGYSPAAIALYGSLGAKDESKSYLYEMFAGD